MKKVSRYIILLVCFTKALAAIAQETELNTASKAMYMSVEERAMIWEINTVRHTPNVYIEYLLPMLADAKKKLKQEGKGQRNYSLTFNSSIKNGKTVVKIDTTWNYANEEYERSLSTLINDLRKLKPLSILLPDSGIYLAAKKHAADQQQHDWKLMHTGSDGSQPWDRITLFSPAMSFGNENIGGRSGYAANTARDMVLQLLIDTGIPGYGHRYNLLNPQWTHVACSIELFKGNYWWWIQNFGSVRK